MAKRRKQYTEEHIYRIVQEIVSGIPVADVSRQHNVSEPTLYRWRQKYGGMELSEVKRLKTLEEENARLKRIVAQQAMDLDALKEVLSKNG